MVRIDMEMPRSCHSCKLFDFDNFMCPITEDFDKKICRTYRLPTCPLQYDKPKTVINQVSEKSYHIEHVDTLNL